VHPSSDWRPWRLPAGGEPALLGGSLPVLNFGTGGITKDRDSWHDILGHNKIKIIMIHDYQLIMISILYLLYSQIAKLSGGSSFNYEKSRMFAFWAWLPL